MTTTITNCDNNKEEQAPNAIPFTHHIFDFDLHPSQPILAAGLINGQVHCYRYGLVSNTLQWSTQISKKSCRGVQFTKEGNHLISISRDKSIQALDVSTGRILYKLAKAHRYPINKLCQLDNQLTATGDDEGIIKIWDMRTCKAVQEYKRHQDYISDMSFCDAKSTLLAAGGDGILSIYDIRQPLTKIKVSQEIDDELLSLTTVKDGQTVIAGSQSGALYIWNNADWSSPPTKWIGHPNSVDALCALDQDTICSGSSDGLLRLITVSPNYKFEGILGDHEDEFPIERIVLTHDRAYMASCGHDLSLRFWNVEFLFESQKKRKRTEEPESVKLSYHTTGNKFDANDTELEGLFENNRQWAKAVQEQDPNFFKTLAEKQEPKILWIGCSDSRVPVNQIVQLGPGEIFIHKNIANVVCHSDLNCLSVLQYAVEVLKVEHIVVCGHSNCGGVAAALGQQQFGLIDNWLRNVKDVYRLNQNEMDKIDNGKERLLKLVEYNAINSAQNIVHSTIVQNAWKRGQKLTVHAWVYNLEKGLLEKLNWAAKDPKSAKSIYVMA